MGIIIRTAYNNNNWSGGCTDASKNNRQLRKCWQNIVDTGWRIDRYGNCEGNCWESTLCTKFVWKHRGDFNAKRAKGRAYFVYSDMDNTLVLWGKSRIRKLHGNTIYFDKFKPFSPECWIKKLTAYDLIGKKWNQGTFRYINSATEKGIEETLRKRQLNVDKTRDPMDEGIFDREGKLLLRKHQRKERSPKLIAQFKQRLANFDCSICGFNFEKKYGQEGIGIIDVHHVKPIYKLRENERVHLSDLVAICSNCHRIIHKNMPPMDWRRLKRSVKTHK